MKTHAVAFAMLLLLSSPGWAQGERDFLRG